MIKKWFFDLWDNLFHSIILSVGFTALMAVPLLLPGLVAAISPGLSLAIVVIGILAIFAYAGAVNRYTLGFVRSEAFLFGDFLKNLKIGLVPSLVLGGISILLSIVVPLGFQFYGSLNNIVGISAIALLFWALVFWFLMIQYWWPLNAQLEPKTLKIVKKCFLLFFDNPIFTIFMLLGALIIIVLSFLTASMFPGFAGLMLWFQVGLKLRMYKYDYLETLGDDANPAKGKVRIPWDSLLADEKERIGHRTLKGMFFPWKE